MSNSLWPHGLQPCLLRPWNFPGKNIGVGCHFQLQGHLPNLGIKPASLVSPALAGRFLFTTSITWELHSCIFSSSCLFPFHDGGFSSLRSGSSREGGSRTDFSNLKAPALVLKQPSLFPTVLRKCAMCGFCISKWEWRPRQIGFVRHKKTDRLWCTVKLSRGQGLYNTLRPWRCVVLINVFPQ